MHWPTYAILAIAYTVYISLWGKGEQKHFFEFRAQTCFLDVSWDSKTFWFFYIRGTKKIFSNFAPKLVFWTFHEILRHFDFFYMGGYKNIFEGSTKNFSNFAPKLVFWTFHEILRLFDFCYMKRGTKTYFFGWSTITIFRISIPNLFSGRFMKF